MADNFFIDDARPPPPRKFLNRLTALVMIAVAVTVITPRGAGAGEFLLFPERPKPLSAETMPYTQALHTGAENGTFYMRGRFGVDFPAVEYDFSEISHPRNILFGITAAANINMLPTDGMRFPVDNFYAVLALYLSGAYGNGISWRLYPVYHVSAHLADGNPGKIINDGVRPVSSEMVRGEAYYKLLGGRLELGAGAGWYYHVCAQKDLKYRGDVSILFTPAIFLWDETVKPFALLRAENVRQNGHNPGVDISAGTFILKDNARGFGLSVRYFNKLHSSYYYEDYEEGWGVEYTFVF